MSRLARRSVMACRSATTVRWRRRGISSPTIREMRPFIPRAFERRRQSASTASIGVATIAYRLLHIPSGSLAISAWRAMRQNERIMRASLIGASRNGVRCAGGQTSHLTTRQHRHRRRRRRIRRHRRRRRHSRRHKPRRRLRRHRTRHCRRRRRPLRRSHHPHRHRHRRRATRR